MANRPPGGGLSCPAPESKSAYPNCSRDPPQRGLSNSDLLQTIKRVEADFVGFAVHVNQKNLDVTLLPDELSHTGQASVIPGMLRVAAGAFCGASWRESESKALQGGGVIDVHKDAPRSTICVPATDMSILWATI